MTKPRSRDPRLPELRFVPVESLIPHEQHDGRRMQTLVHRLRNQAVLKNPPIVAPFGDEGSEGRYVVLDGANRVTAAGAAGLPHMLVQVVRYTDPGVRLSTWYHALCDYPREAFQAALRKIRGLKLEASTPVHARALLARREALACVVFPDCVLMLVGGGDLPERNAQLNEIVDLYRDRSFYRTTSDSLDEACASHSDVTALVVFPHFEPVEILELAMSGARLPAGITRHVIPWRALRINLPLDRLADTEHSLEEKNRWLDGWIQERFSEKQVRFYEEPTVLFDE